MAATLDPCSRECRDEEGRSCAPLLALSQADPSSRSAILGPIRQLMLTVLGGIAAFERDLILQRTNGVGCAPCRGHEVWPQA